MKVSNFWSKPIYSADNTLRRNAFELTQIYSENCAHLPQVIVFNKSSQKSECTVTAARLTLLKIISLKQQLFLLGQTMNYKEFISKQLLHSCYGLLAAKFILVKYA